MKTIGSNTKNRKEINTVVSRFFNAFSNTNNEAPKVSSIREFTIPQAVIINNTNGVSEVFTVEEFVASREKILSSGNLKDFSEQEIFQKTEVHDYIAQRWSHYEKTGIRNSKSFKAEGIKNFHFIKTSKGWRIASVQWSDINQ